MFFFPCLEHFSSGKSRRFQKSICEGKEVECTKVEISETVRGDGPDRNNIICNRKLAEDYHATFPAKA
jgi:hypothetical protein